MSSDTPTAAHSPSALAEVENLAMPVPIVEASASSTEKANPAELAAAAREIAIETLRDPAAQSAMTSEQKAQLERRVAIDPNSPEAPRGVVEEETNQEERKQAYFDQLARMIVTRNIVTEKIRWVHFKRSTEPEFKRLLDDAIAAKENDPAMLAEKELVMGWRLEVERQKHEHVWALWQAENIERARKVAAMRARAHESSAMRVD
jgi:hypothetical protein